MLKVRPLLVLGFLAALAAAPAGASGPSGPAASTEAVRIAREASTHWQLGRLVLRTRKGKAARVEAELVIGTTVIARLRVHPDTGQFLARHRHPAGASDSPDLTRLREVTAREIGGLEVGTWGWPSEHGRAWGVPLRYQGRVVGKLKVDVRNGRVLAAHAEEEEEED